VAGWPPNQEGYNRLMGQLQLEQALSMFPDYAYEAVSQAQEQDYINSQLEDNVASNVQFTVDDYLQGLDVSDGISEDETKLAFDLLSTGAVTVADLEAKTGIPASAIQSTYDTIAAANAAQAQADFAAATAAADAEERRVTGMLNEFGETYAEEQARLAFERSAAAEAIMKSNTLAAESAARQAAQAEEAAQAAAASPEAAETQRKDDDFDAKVNAAGGVTPGTIDKVIDAALEVYGDDSRGVVKVISESLKGGLTMKDLEEATDLSGDEILEAAKTAANDPNKSLTPGEILSGATNTVYDTTNKIVDIVEKGLEVTGIEKVIDVIGNTVSKIGGLVPGQTQKVLVVNPVTGQVTVQASNIPGGGILRRLPQSPYVPIGSTSGGTTYGIDFENAILNVVLGKILTNGGLDLGDTKSVIAAGVEEVTGIPMEVAGNVIDVAGAVIDETGKLIDNSGILNVGDESFYVDSEGNIQVNIDTTGFETINGQTRLCPDGITRVGITETCPSTTDTDNDDDSTLTTTGGTGDTTLTGGASATDGLMGPFQLDDDGNTILPSSSTSNTTLTTEGDGDNVNITNNIICPEGTYLNEAKTGCVKDVNYTGDILDKVICPENTILNATGTACINEITGQVTDVTVCPEGSEKDANGNCINKITGQVTDVTVCPEGSEKDANGNCINKITGQVTDVTVCPEGSEKDANGNCINKITGQVTDVTVCPEGSEKDANGNCINKITGQVTDVTVCPEGSEKDANGNCINKITGQVTDVIVCPEGSEKDANGNCINKITGQVTDVTVCPEALKRTEKGHAEKDANGNCINKITGQVTDVIVCPEGSEKDANGNCINKITGQVTDVTVCPEGSEKDANGNCINKITGQVTDVTVCPEGSEKDANGNCINKITGQVTDVTVCPEGSEKDANGNCINKITGQVTDVTVCPEGSEKDANGNCINKITGQVTDVTVCPEGSEKDANGNCINKITGQVTDVTVCPEGSEKDANGNCINKITGQVTDVTVCPEGSEKDANGNCINKITGQVTDVIVCPEGSEKDANGNCVVTTYMDVIENKICPDGSYELDGICYSDVTGEVVENTICPAGTTYNETSQQCEYSKYLCPPGFTFNILTSKCEPDEAEEETTGGITTLPTPDLKVPGRGDFVTADDVLVENTGDVGGIYSILPAPVREPFLAGRRQQDIRNVADTVGIQQGAELEQDQAAVDRFAGYANAFDVGTPELLDISGVLPGDLPGLRREV
jgi:hypothetical protein